MTTLQFLWLLAVLCYLRHADKRQCDVLAVPIAILAAVAAVADAARLFSKVFS